MNGEAQGTSNKMESFLPPQKSVLHNLPKVSNKGLWYNSCSASSLKWISNLNSLSNGQVHNVYKNRQH